MKEIFADKFNLVVFQCDYFGSLFMQSSEKFTLKDSDYLKKIFNPDELNKIKRDSNKLLEILALKNIVFNVRASIDESINHFNDMGLMQAIDILTAIEAMKLILNDNNLQFNKNRIIGYGHSHGSYLLHLANILSNNTFSYIVDNSAWIEPVYLTTNRLLYQTVGTSTLAIEFDYLAKEVIADKSNLNLGLLYNNNDIQTQILTFQGNNDNLINHLEKEKLINQIINGKYILVTENDIDNKKYKSNTHGLGADFLELFSYAMTFESHNIPINTSKEKIAKLDTVEINVDYGQGLPVFTVK